MRTMNLLDKKTRCRHRDAMSAINDYNGKDCISNGYEAIHYSLKILYQCKENSFKWYRNDLAEQLPA